jgi:hypothetical protein
VLRRVEGVVKIDRMSYNDIDKVRAASVRWGRRAAVAVRLGGGGCGRKCGVRWGSVDTCRQSVDASVYAWGWLEVVGGEAVGAEGGEV